MEPFSEGTDPDAHAVQVALLRRLSPGQRMVRSDRQLRDVRREPQVLGDALDEEQMCRWASEVGVADLLERVLLDAERSD